ncbi:MAG: DivIVA domain-containing protein [Gaiellaceae bacterium]
MERYGVAESNEVSVVEDPGRNEPATAATRRDEPLPERIEPLPERIEPQPAPVGPLPERVEPSGERQALHAEVERLEAELERYRVHAERTSKLFLSATSYAEWVRESARRDAELALRKARVRVQRLEASADDLERTERKLVRAQRELDDLQALTEETRERLSAFLSAGLQALNVEGAAGPGDRHEPALGDLQDTLHRQLDSNSVPEPRQPAEVERPDR